MAAVRNAIDSVRAQPAAIDHRPGERRVAPAIGCASRRGPELAVVGVDVVVGDVGQFIGIEQILVRYDVGPDLVPPGDVAVGAEVSVGVGRLQLDADIFALVVVERRQHIGSAELSVIEQVARGLVVGVDADREAGKDLLFDADIEHVGSLRQYRAVGVDGRLLRGALYQRQIGGGGEHQRRRREVSRIAGVESGVLERLVGQADARAELVGGDILIHLIETQAGIQRQLVGDLPFVLNVGAEQPSQFRARIGDAERRIVGIAVAIDRQNDRGIVDIGLFAGDRETSAQCMRIVQLVRPVSLDSLRNAAPIDIRSHPVEHQIADRVGHEVDAAVASERGKLQIESIDRLLQGKNAEMILLDLVFIQQRRIEIRDAEGGEGRRLAGIVRNLVAAGRRAADEGQAGILVDQRRQIDEALVLLRPVVNGVA